MSPVRKRGVRLTSEGKKVVVEAIYDIEKEQDIKLTSEKIGLEVGFDPKTIRRFLNRTGNVEPKTATKILRFLNLSSKESDIIDTGVAPSKEEEYIDTSIEGVKQAQAKGIGSSERASSLIKELEASLEVLQTNKDASFKSMEWLKFHREALSKEAARAALEEHHCDDFTNFMQNHPEEVELLGSQIKKYLHLVYLCLDAGTWEVIDTAVRERLIPSNKDTALYVKALKFIRDRKIKNDESLSEYSEMMLVYFDYLVRILPVRLSK